MSLLPKVSSAANYPIDAYQQNQNANTPTPQKPPTPKPNVNSSVSELASKTRILSNKFVSDKSGQDGKRGMDGDAGENGRSSGSSGKEGQSGADGQVGKNGQDIHITLRADEQKKIIRIENPNGQHRKLPLDSPESEIILKAGGGKGGHGGYGGRGGNGADGSKGNNATGWVAGGDGEAGGDGGRGGRGGLGANGGKSGHVVVEIDERDADLLMLVTTPTLEGGEEGSGGTGGKGGAGGSGGAGGNRYDSDESYKPGGRSGLDGDFGSKGARGKDGLRGEKGTYTIKVSGVGYSDKYDLSYSSSKKIVSDDGIIEPNETLDIRGLVFRNSGKMPTPKDQILVYLESNEWVHFNKEHTLKIPGSIDPEKSIVLFEPLKFTVKPQANSIPAVNSIFAEKLKIDFRAKIARVDKEFETVIPQNAWYRIRYPVQMSIVSSTHTISRGEEAPIAIRVLNISKKAVGHKAQDPRPLSIDLQVTDGISGKSLQFYDRSENSTSDLSKPFSQEINDLKRTDIKYVSGALQFTDPKTPAYTKITLTFNLHLGKLHRDGEEIIQQRTFTMQLADPYRYDDKADFVLVTNSVTNRKTVKLWENVAKRLGTKISLWNTSLYSGLSYTQKRRDQESWISQLNGKVIIILNDAFSIGIDKRIRSTEYLDPMEIFEAARSSGVATYVIGDGFNIKKAITPLSDREVKHYTSIKEIVASKREEVAEPQYYEMIVKRIFQKEPKESALIKEAIALNMKLQKQFPDQQNLPVYTFQPTKVTYGEFPTWELGTIQFRRGLDKTHAHIAYRQGETKSVEDADVYTVIKLLPFTRKLDLIEASVKKDGAHASTLKVAILSDLVDEMLTYGQDKWKGAFSKKILREHLRQLETLINYNFSKALQSEPGKQFVIKLLLKYHYLAERLSSMGDKLVFSLILRKMIAKTVTTKVDQLLKRFNDLGTSTHAHRQELLKSLKTTWGPVPDQALLGNFSDPYSNIAFDNKIPLTAVSTAQLPEYVPRPSGFKEGQGLFASAEERNHAIKSYEEKCEFDYKDPYVMNDFA